MKKLFILLSVIGLVSFSSCNKDYTCTCTSTGNVQVIIIPSVTANEAKTICAGDAQYTSGGTPISCKLN